MPASTAGQWPATSTRRRGSGEKQDQGKSRRALMREAREHAAQQGVSLGPAEIRLAVSGHQSSADQGRTPAEILHRARNAYGYVDETGETAAFRVDAQRRARRPIGCTCGCTSPDECVTQRPAPIGAGSCCGAYGLEQLAQGIGCPRHTQRRAVIA